MRSTGARVPTTRHRVGRSDRFSRQCLTGTPALNAIESPEQRTVAQSPSTNVSSPSRTKTTSSLASCQCFSADRDPGSRTSTKAPNWVSPAASLIQNARAGPQMSAGSRVSTIMCLTVMAGFACASCCFVVPAGGAATALRQYLRYGLPVRTFPVHGGRNRAVIAAAPLRHIERQSRRSGQWA